MSELHPPALPDLAREALLDDKVRAAFDAAVSWQGVVTSAGLFYALWAVDTAVGWDRVWDASFTPAAALARVPDPPSQHAGTWQGARVTASVKEAVRSAERLAVDHEFDVVSIGLLAAELAGNPHCGAARALSGSDPSHRAALVVLCEEELLGVSLERRPAHGELEGDEAPAAATPRRVRDELDLVADALDDPRAGPYLASWGLDHELLDRLRSLVPRSERRPADVVIDRAKALPGGLTSPSSLVARAAEDPSPAMESLAWLLWTTGPSLAAYLRRTEISGTAKPPRPSWTTFIPALVLMVTGLALAVLTVMSVISTGRWWEAVLLLFAFSGYPLQSQVISVLAAVAFALVLGPVALGVKLVHVVFDVGLAFLDRSALQSQTGVRLRVGEHRKFVLRAEKGRPTAAKSKLRAEKILATWTAKPKKRTDLIA